MIAGNKTLEARVPGTISGVPQTNQRFGLALFNVTRAVAGTNAGQSRCPGRASFATGTRVSSPLKVGYRDFALLARSEDDDQKNDDQQKRS
jgi:hypothetical protein